MPAPLIIARPDLTLRPRIRSAQPLLYTDGPNHLEDRPPHVRAASALVWWRDHLVIVQDDANFLGLWGGGETVGALTLPKGPGGRRIFDETLGNKKEKLDLEAAFVLPDDRLVVLGSGSMATRDRLIVVSSTGAADIHAGLRWYDLLRREMACSGSELNVEGAMVLGSVLRIFQRANGVRHGASRPVNASVDFELDPFLNWLDRGGQLPSAIRVRRYDLGHEGSIPYGFTDVTRLEDGRIAFLAVAEATANPQDDGDILGCRWGILTETGAWYAPIQEADGTPSRRKIEGLAARPGEPVQHFWAVEDADNHTVPANLLRLVVEGFR